MSLPLLTLAIALEQDVVAARQRARQVAALVGFDQQDQTRIATAVSEISRNAFAYGGGGRVEFIIEGRTTPQVLLIRISDRGRGIARIEKVLAGEYKSNTGMGLGIIGTRRLMDGFDVQTAPGKGTTVTLKKFIPHATGLLTNVHAGRIAAEMERQAPRGLLDEVQLQNRELLRGLEELQRRQEELSRVNRELEETNRGVVALYAELDERADHLRRADQLKSRFLSNMSHEFRSPLNSISALCRLLLDDTDGELADEQKKQVSYVRKAAEDLAELVNDLLDLAKVEAGKVVVHPTDFALEDLFGALRGMLRPLLVTESVRLIFENPAGLPTMRSDEAKVSQILRNFISNALKFTESGEVRVEAAMSADATAMVFSVSDTGIGIAAEDLDRIFEEFSQIDSPVQRKVKGTGLGLPLTRRFVELLGGKVSVISEPGVGSTFSATIPIVYSGSKEADSDQRLDYNENGSPVLILEDNPQDLLLYEKYLYRSGFAPIPAKSISEARRVLSQVRPVAIVLDIVLKGEESWTFLAEVKRDSRTADIPVFIISSVEDQQKGLALGADAYALKPVTKDWLIDQLCHLTGKGAPPRILVIDDDDISRYLVKHALPQPAFQVTEANNGPDGLTRARREHPNLILLDVVMDGMDGIKVLDKLKEDPATSDIPVVMITSQVMTDVFRAELSHKAVAIVSKCNAFREGVASVVMNALGIKEDRASL